METTFDALKFFEELKAADVPEKQAKVLAEGIRSAFVEYDASRMKEVATRGDLLLVRKELGNEIRETELRLQKEIEANRTEMQKIKYDMLKWQFGIAIALGVIMAKGFGWLGF